MLADTGLLIKSSKKTELLELTQQLTRVGGWEWIAGEERVWCTDEVFHMLGFELSADNYISFSVLSNFIHPEDVSRIRDIQLKLTSKHTQEEYLRIVTLSEDILHFRLMYKCSTDDTGKPIKVSGSCQDVTEHRTIQQQLLEQSDFAQMLIDGSVNCIQVVDANMRYVLWNKRTMELYRLTQNDVIGKTAREVYPTHDVSWFEDAVRRALAGETVTIEHLKSSVTGHTYRFHFTPISTTQNRVTHVFVLMVDISHLKLIEEKLTSANEKLSIENTALKNAELLAHLGTWKWNTRTGEIFASDNLYRLFGYEPGAFDMSYDRLLSMVHPDDVKELLLAKDRVENNNEGSRRFFRIIRKDGSIRYAVGDGLTTRNAHGDTVVIGTTQDITEEHLLRQELRQQKDIAESIVNHTMACIMAFDGDMRLIEWNRKAEESYGKKKEEVLGKLLTEIFPAEAVGLATERLKRALNGEVIYCPPEKSNVLDTYFESYVVPVKSPDGIVTHVITVLNDVTGVVEAAEQIRVINEQLKDQNDELERLNSELASLSYMAGNDLQDPLRKIQAFASLILTKEHTNLSETAQDYFNRIKISASRMQEMINGLISFSGANTASKELEPKDLSEELKKVVSILQDDIIRTKAVIHTEPLPTVKIIPGQFQQMLLHLVENTLKFRQKEHLPVIKISAARVLGKDITGEVAERQRSYHKIVIKDNGIGFAPEQADKIFELFYRLHTKEYPGAGVGLAICKRIAGNHNGFITAESKTGEGATFNIYIPADI